MLGTLFLCLVVIAAGLVLRLPRWSTEVDVGAEGPLLLIGETEIVQNFFGYHEPEMTRDGTQRTFRWTSSELAALTIPYALRMQPVQLEVVACGCRFDGSTTPLTLELNNSPVLNVDVTDEWRHYHIAVPSTLTHPDYGLMVVLNAPMWESPEGRHLGAAVDRIVVRQTTLPSLTDLGSLPALLVGLLVLLWWRQWLLLPLLLSSGWLVVNALYQPQLLPRWLLASLLVVGLLLLWWQVVRGAVAQSSPPATPSGEPGRVVRYAPGYWFSLWLATIIGLWLVLTPQVLGHWIIDDAFISFRYARNLVDGHGLVFNVGERVEGYTNFLWTVIIAAGIAAGGDPIVLAAVLTLLLAFVIVMLTLMLAQRMVPAGWVWAAPLLLVVSSPFLLYTTRGSGMETALFTGLILAALVALVHRRWLLAGLLVALTVLTRPDGVLLAAMGGVYVLVATPSNETRQDRTGVPPRLLAYAGAFLALFVPYFAWRWSYYGYLLPNTFYVKVGGTWAQVQHGAAYLLAFGRDHLLLFVCGVGVLAGVWCWRDVWRQQWREVGLLAGLVLLFCSYMVVVGGDWIPGARFAVPIIPLLAILVVWGLVGLAHRCQKSGSLAFVILLALLVVLAVRLPRESSFDHTTAIWTQNYAVRRYREVGRWINQHTPPETWVATGVAGAIPYYAERPTIDALGLTDLHIAHLPSTDLGTGRPGHEKSDPGYVLERRPELITYKESYTFWDHPLLKANYRLRSFPGPEGQAVWLYVRKDSSLMGEHE